MNPKFQPDLHPDADLLSAFAEHALPETERTRILAHMAECGRCREVVFLAQAAVEPQVLVAPAQGPRAHSPWFSAAFARWRVALIPAAALAAVAAAVVWVRLHPAPAAVQTAQMVAPPPSPQGSVAAPVAPQPVVTAPPDRPVASPAAAPSTKTALPARQARKTAAPDLSVREELAQNPSSPLSLMDRKRALGSVHLDARSASLALQAPSAAAPGAPPEMTFAPAQINPPIRQQPLPPPSANRMLAARSAPAPAPSPPDIIAVHRTAMAPATGGPQLLASQGAAPIDTFPESNGFAMMHLARRAKLPSGLHAVSSAAMLNRLVALDSAGALFLSADGGKHWEPVTAQWTGKALQVQAPPDRLYSAGAETSQAVSLPETASVDREQKETPQAPLPAALDANAGPPAPPKLFKLVTDRHQTWISADGKVWREQ